MSEVMTEITEDNKTVLQTKSVDGQRNVQCETLKTAAVDEEGNVQKSSYKERRKTHKLFWLVQKNTLVFWLPAIILLGVIVFFTWKYPIVYRNISRHVENLDEMQQWYDEQCYNVIYSGADLKYTGYDYYENDRLTGAYYYTFEGDRCLFVLMKTKNPESEVVAARIHGRMLKDSAHTEAVLDQFASDVGMNQNTFFQVVSPLVISEVDYSWSQTILIWVLVIMPGILGVIALFSGIEWMIHPYLHPNLKKLDEFGKRKEVYYEINSQMNRENVLHQDHYYFTDDYLILNRFGELDFVRIDRVHYVSKHAFRDRKNRQKYRLIMSDDKKTYFERDFKSESIVDTILKEMISRNAMIDDRTIHVFNIQVSETEASQMEAPEIKVLAQETGSLRTETTGIAAEAVGIHAEEEHNIDKIEKEKEAIPVYEPAEKNVDDTEVPLEADDSENLKIYKVRRRLRKKEEEADQVKIYKVRHRLRRDKYNE